MNKPRLVILDDHETVTRLFAYELTASGWDAVAFTDPHAALAHMESQSIDVLLIDYRMPRMTGIEVVTRLRGAGWAGAVLMVTGSPGDLDDATVKSLGIFAVLEKPVGICELKQYLGFVAMSDGSGNGNGCASVVRSEPPGLNSER